MDPVVAPRLRQETLSPELSSGPKEDCSRTGSASWLAVVQCRVGGVLTDPVTVYVPLTCGCVFLGEVPTHTLKRRLSALTLLQTLAHCVVVYCLVCSAPSVTC